MSDLNVPATVPLNRSELNYLAMEGVLGSIGMTFVLRFEAPLPEGAMRAAMRRLVSVHPRLRGVVESRPFAHRLRILEDDAHVDRLFHEAYREVEGEGADLASVERYVEGAMNARFDVERGLCVRAHLLVGSARPVLVLTIHHILADGRGAVMILDDLMKLLNGVPVDPVPLDDPSMFPAILPPPGPDRLAILRRSYARDREARRALAARKAILLDANRSGRFGATGLRLRVLPVRMKSIRHVASQRGFTVGSLVLAAVASAIGASNAKNDGDAATVRVSVDLRKYFPKESRPKIGNYVATFVIPLTRLGSTPELAREAERGMREGIAGFDAREMFVPLLLQEVASKLGPTFFGIAARIGKRFGWVPVNTCHYSNIGDTDGLNRHGDDVRITEFFGSAPTVCPFFASMGLNDRVCISASFDRDELSDRDADALMDALERALVALVDEAEPRRQSSSAPPPA